MTDKAKKKGHPVRNTTIGVGVLAALALLFGPKLGLGAGLGVIPAMGQTAPQVQQEQQAEPEQKPAEQSADKNRIKIEDGIIYYMDKAVTAEELKEALVENVEEGVVTIEGDKAIKGAYDAVTSLLTELGIEYEG